jgi:flagellar motor protein MotB
MRKNLLLMSFLLMAPWALQAAHAPSNFYNEGMTLYNAGRNSEAIDAFENAIKHKDRAADSQHFIERIRKETVERIRNRALTGVSKTSWQNKYFFIRTVGGRVRVGISSQEMFERQSINFRQGAVDALVQLSTILQHNDNAVIDIEVISEVNQDSVINKDLLARQLAELYTFLSMSSMDLLPKY